MVSEQQLLLFFYPTSLFTSSLILSSKSLALSLFFSFTVTVFDKELQFAEAPCFYRIKLAYGVWCERISHRISPYQVLF